MNRKIGICVVVLWAVTWLRVPVFGQSAKIEFNLDHLAKHAVETVNVTLDRSMLDAASKFLSSKDADQEDMKKLVQGLDGIWVRSFEFDREGVYSQEDVDAIRKQLSGPGWSCVVKVESKKKGGETADVCLRQEDDRIFGLVVLVAEPKELTFVNIAGNINLEQLKALEGKFGIPEMGVSKKHPKTSTSKGK